MGKLMLGTQEVTPVKIIEKGSSYGIPRENVNGKLSNTSTSYTCPEDITSIGYFAMFQVFDSNTNLSSVSFPNVTTLDEGALHDLCDNCSNLTSASLPKLVTVGKDGLNSAFRGCTSLTTVNMANLETVMESGLRQTFASCTGLTSFTFSSLKEIEAFGLYQAFLRASNISSISFPSLDSNSFPDYQGEPQTNQFYNMLSVVTGCTVHFPSNLQSVIGSWTDVQNGFGGTNTTVLFDLPATE